MTPEDPEITVVIPAYNEETCLGGHLETIISHLRRLFPSPPGAGPPCRLRSSATGSGGRRVTAGAYAPPAQGGSLPWEVIVVDDGSRDRTQNSAGEFFPEGVRILRNPVNRGKGYSVRRGILRARGKFILFTDADLSTPIEEMDGLVRALRNGYDVAIASRSLPRSRIVKKQSYARALLGRAFLWCVHRLIFTEFSDTQCGFKAFSRDAAMRLFRAQRINGYAFDVEVLLLSQKFGLKVAEVPVVWKDAGRSSISILSPRTIRMLVDILLLHLRYRSSLTLSP